MNNHKQNVEDIISSYMIKYNVLDYIIPYGYSGSKATNLNIYIDLYGLFRHILSRNYSVEIRDHTSIATGIINICAHYRSYFKFLGVHTKFFLISSFNVPQNSVNTIVNFPDANNSNDVYNKLMLEKLQIKSIKDILDLNLELLDLICPYLPDIFYLKTDFESTVLMNHIMNLEDSEIPSLIISRDILPVQLTATRLNTSYVWPRKYMAEDLSNLICHKTHVEHKKSFWNDYILKSSKTSQFEDLYSIDTSNFALVGALSGIKERNFKPILYFGQTIKVLNEIAGSNCTKIDPRILFDMTNNNIVLANINLITNRYQTIDIQYQYMMYLESPESKTVHYENLDDPNVIQAINDKYFRNNPIDIFRL